MIELKPCPFCGGKAKLLRIKEPVGEFWRVYCMNEDCYIEPQSRLYSRKEITVEAWNRRVSDGV